MEPTLIAVTLLSLAMALAMSVIAWRLLREERRRSAARVDALIELAARNETAARSAVPANAASGDPLVARLDRSKPLVAEARANERVEIRDGLFAVSSSSGGGRRALVLALAAVLVVSVIAGLAVLSGARATAGAARTAALVAPLELVSLRHTLEGDALTITGLVQNPADGRELRHVVAVASAFDKVGALVATARAPLESDRLVPGGGSPFVITIPNAAEVGRYRVGFRSEDGGVLGHVDRRSARSAAAPEQAAAVAPTDQAASARPGS